MAMDPRLSGHQTVGFGGTTLAAAKIAVIFVSVLSSRFVVCAALPVVASALSSGIPHFWAAFRSSLGHPFMFVALNVIIFAIWKLSDWKQHSPAEAVNLAKVKSFDGTTFLVEPIVRKSSPKIWHEIQSAPITPLSSISSPGPTPAAPPQYSEVAPPTVPQVEPCAVPKLEINKLVEPASKREIPVVEEYASSAVEELDDEEDNPTMEAMWKAIMEKTPRNGTTTLAAMAAAALPPATPRRGQVQPETAAGPVVTRGREPSMTSHEELNQRFDDFIKKNYEQMRRNM